jgi:hypothetical protein
MTLEVRVGPGIDADLGEAIRGVLDRRLSGLGLERAEITLTEDHDGEPMLLVEAFFSEENRLPAPDLRRPERPDTRDDPVWLARRELVGAVGSHLPGVFPLLRLRIPDADVMVRRKA